MDNKTLAWKILSALRDSSLSQEFQLYRKDVQRDLQLSDEQMNSLYNLDTICDLLQPTISRERLYKGKPICQSDNATENDAQVEKESVDEKNITTRSCSGDKNKHPAAKAMRKLLRTVGIDYSTLSFDTEKSDKALLIFGNTKAHTDQLTQMGGKWNTKVGGWVFNKSKLIEAMEVAQSRKNEVVEKENDNQENEVVKKDKDSQENEVVEN